MWYILIREFRFVSIVLVNFTECGMFHFVNNRVLILGSLIFACDRFHEVALGMNYETIMDAWWRV